MNTDSLQIKCKNTGTALKIWKSKDCRDSKLKSTNEKQEPEEILDQSALGLGLGSILKSQSSTPMGRPSPLFFWNLLSSPLNENLLLLAAGAV
jgi:hypothetical protein